MDFRDWLRYRSKLENRDVSKDTQDYDLESYYNNLKANPVEGGHLPDTYKKPNHPTFSDQSMYHIPGVQEGGKWNENEFTPSAHNLSNMPAEHMQQYFNEVETPEALNLPNNNRFSQLRDRLKK